MNDWVRIDDEDLDRLTEECRRDQQRLLDEEVPTKIAALYAEVYGPDWKATREGAYILTVALTRSLLSKIIDAANIEYATARAQGFPEPGPPVLH